MTQTEGIMDRGGLRTWYRVLGDLSTGPAPLVICHGGPGLTHDYLTSVAELAGTTGRACVLYDQLGNGHSSRHPGDPDFWTVELFRTELEDLVEHLGIAGGYHVYGHSWGGMLALELAARRPAGLRSIVVASAFARSKTYSHHVGELVRALPDEVRETIERHEAAGTTDSTEYQQAIRFFYRRHVHRRQPVPDELMRTLVALGEDSTVYRAMAGPSEFSMTGSLKDWDITGRLAEIEVPVLLVSGRHDEVAPAAVNELYLGLQDARWELFEDSSHMPHLEEHDRLLRVVAGFLAGEPLPSTHGSNRRAARAEL